MAQKFTVRFPDQQLKALQRKITELGRPLNRSEAKELGSTTVKEMKKLIAVGSSPIRGKGRFKAYRGGYRRQIRKTGRVAGKAKKLRPVNLKLTGAFLKDLKGNVVKQGTKGFTASVGYRKGKQQKKEKGHRDGKFGQAERPTIPEGSETFAVTISQKIIKIIDKAIGRINKRPLR